MTHEETEVLLVRRVARVALVGSVAFGAAAAVNVILGVYLAAIVDAAGSVALVLLRHAVLRARGPRTVFRLSTCILAVPVLALAIVDSLLPGLTLYWMAVVPLAAAWLFDERTTTVWTGVAVGGVLVTSTAIAFGLNGEDVDPGVVWGNAGYFSLFMMTVGAIAVAGRRVIERHALEVEYHRWEAEVAKGELEALNAELADRVRERTARLTQALEDVRRTARAKAVLMSNLTHEFRTPLNGVLGASTLLSESELSDEQRELVDALAESGLALRNVLEGLLDCVDLDAGSLQLADSAFDPVAVVEGVVAAHTRAGAAKGIAVASLCLPRLPHTVHGDPVRVREILDCLVDNAVKFTDAGHVIVRVSWSGRGLHLGVEDTGCGFDLDRKGEMFALLVQGNGTATREHQGLGVGLGLARRLVDLMGGEIDVTSTPGAGSTFEVVLPLHDPQFDEAMEAPLAGRRISVLAGEAYGPILVEGLAAWGADARLHGAERGEEDSDLLVVHDSVARSAAEVIIARRQRGTVPVSGARLRWRELIGRLQAAASTPDAAQAPAEGSGRGPVVLVVEDNALNQKVLKAMLERDGCEVVLASNGRQGVDVFEERMDVIEIVLMDCQMPVLDGYGATREIRAVESARGRANVPIVAVTANAGPEDREKCLAAGMDEYVAKPVTPEELGEMLGRLTRERSRET
ncbi:MAG: response regulator [Acidimicrobiia bacterium]|nr:response regulator [Acidimicrobiia bacterium]